MFFVEHFNCAFVIPLVLCLSGRYYTRDTISFRNHLFAHSVFGFYQRGVLFPVSLLTYANLNMTLCPALGDPFESSLGRWYYLISDLYIFIAGEIFHNLVKFIINTSFVIGNYVKNKNA